VLSHGPFWGNAHDIKKLAKDMKQSLFSSVFDANRDKFRSGEITELPPLPQLSGEKALACTKKLIESRRSRCKDHRPGPDLISEDLCLPKFEYQYATAEQGVPPPILAISIIQAPREMTQHFPAAVTHSHNYSRLGGRHTAATGPVLLIASHTMSLAALQPLMHTSDSLLYQKPDTTRRVFEIEEDEDKVTESEVAATTTADGTTIEATNDSAKDTAGEKTVVETKKEREESIAARKARLKKKYQFTEDLAVNTAQALKDLGPCPCGYTWKRDLARHVCMGGTHYVYDGYLRDYMDTHGY
jgi:hypothetical protein